jgi:drug/metabolite transporter (DMT)-like permease
MAGWLCCMMVMVVAGREATHELHVFQVTMMRSVLGLFMVYPLLRAAGGFGAVKTSRPWLQILRNAVHYCAQFSWFMALTLIPLTQVIAIEFTMPIWTAILAVSFLGERMGLWKNIAVVTGLIGVAIIVRPLSGSANVGQLAALAAAVGYAASVIMVKALTRTESTIAIIFWMMVIQSALGLVPGLLVWRWPSPYLWAWLLVIGFVGTYSHYCMTRALRYADATTVVPMDFLRVPLAALVGWLVYAERVDIVTVLGAALILTANLLNLKGPAPARSA